MALIHGGIILIRYGWHTNCTDQLLQPQYICLSDYSLVNSEKFTNFALLNTDLYSIIALCILRHDMKNALKKYLWIIISIISVVSLESMYASPSGNTESVYYCTGPKSKRYHIAKDCKGLEHCSGEIKKCSKINAINKGLTPCRYCYKK